LIVNAIGDADLCPRALLAAEAIVARGAAPVINPPAERKRFFFEKKNQKTFIHWSAWPETGVAQRREKFFGSFFQKRTSFLPLPCWTTAPDVNPSYMNWSSDTPGRRGYHHGNLREALIDAALELIASKGPAGFTVAEAARLAGVSPAAPYRHFRDADALLAEVAVRGFDRLAEKLAAAWNHGTPRPSVAFEATGRAYLAFARTETAYYAAMFDTRLAIDAHPTLQAASDRAFAVLREAAEIVSAAAPKDRRPPALMMALHVWSMAHGIASLFVRGGPARRKLPMSAEDLLEAGLLIYLQSLGLIDPLSK
jgi:AcrR family transcriptional regulator